MTTVRPFLVSLFIVAPISVLPLLDTSARIDLIDYYEANMAAKVENRYEGISEMTELSDSLVEVRLTDVSTIEMRLTNDSNVVVRHTYTLPEGNIVSEKVYDREWKRIK